MPIRKPKLQPPPAKVYVAVNDKTGEQIKEGDTVKDFRGDEHEFICVSRGNTRVYLKHKRTGFKQEYFPQVINAKIVEREV